MTTRTQGLLLGSLVLLAVFLVVGSALTFLFGRHRDGVDLGFAGGGGGRIGLVVVDGPISDSRELLEEVDALRRDGSVKAVVLRVNSPGGEVGPSQELHDAVARLSAEKPVVVSVGAVAASGAYYAAMAADSIVSSPGSVIGSIGVILSYPTAVELMEKVGVEWRVYKSGRLKDMGSFARNPTEEEEAVMDGVIADVFDQFVSAVVTDRGLDRDTVLGLADGRIFTGRQALEAGLVDRLGDYQAAVTMAAGMAGIAPETPVVRKTRPRFPLLDFLDNFLGEQARSTWGPRLEYRLR
jgi:protease-4